MAEGRRSSGMRDAAIVGAVLGAIVGAVFWAAYGAFTVYMCTADLLCPDHWAPFAVVPAIGFIVTTGLAAVAAMVMRKIYLLLRVD